MKNKMIKTVIKDYLVVQEKKGRVNNAKNLVKTRKTYYFLLVS